MSRSARGIASIAITDDRPVGRDRVTQPRPRGSPPPAPYRSCSNIGPGSRPWGGGLTHQSYM